MRPLERRALLERPDGSLRASRRPGREHHDLALGVPIDDRLGVRCLRQRRLVVVAHAQHARLGAEIVAVRDDDVGLRAFEDCVSVGGRRAWVHERHRRADAHRGSIRLDELRTVRQHDRHARPRPDTGREEVVGEPVDPIEEPRPRRGALLERDRDLVRVPGRVQRVDQVRLEPLALELPDHLGDRPRRDRAQQARSREEEGVFGGLEDRPPGESERGVEDAHAARLLSRATTALVEPAHHPTTVEFAGDSPVSPTSSTVAERDCASR